MSKEEFLKIKTCVLKVNIHCDGCKHKVKKILQKIEGVYTTKIDSEQGKVTVSGIVEPATLIKKLVKNGKHAELWGAPKAANNQNQLNNQLKNMQIDHGKGGNKGQGQKGVNNQPKGGQQGQNNQQQQQQQQQQQLQQLQKLKGFADLKLPQFKDLKMPFNNNKAQNQKAVKFNVPDDDDDEYDDDYEFDDDDEYDDDYEFDDEIDDTPLNKMKPIMNNGHGGGQMPNMILNGLMNGQHPQLMQGGNVKKGGGGGNIPVQVNMGGGGGGGGGNAKKGGGNGNNNGGNQNQGGGAAKNGGKNGGGQPLDGKNGGGGGGQNKNGNNGGGGGAGGGAGGKKGGGMNDGFHGMMPNMMPVNGGAKAGQMGNMPMGQMGQMGNMPMGQMGNVPVGQMGNVPVGQMGQMGSIPAVQGLPAAAVNGGAGGYYQGAGPEMMPGNPYYQQQQLAAMMMNQQRANGNERFQPMMYARPPPAVNYMPPYPYPYPPQQDHYSSIFSDENTSSCSIM